MKVKVIVSIPAYITEVEVDTMDGEKIPGLDTTEQKQAYARNVALEQVSDNIRSGVKWYDYQDMVALILPGE